MLTATSEDPGVRLRRKCGGPALCLRGVGAVSSESVVDWGFQRTLIAISGILTLH
jgi:hypothetical protein